MALYAFDGTWNKAKDNDETGENTNVFRMYQAYKRNSGSKWDFYCPGVGTRLGFIGAIFGGGFGMGELRRLIGAYDQLCKAWDDGDQTIDIIGFSRGAATTLDFCHVIQEKGIRKPGTDTVIEPSPQIRFLGVWDIVGAFGVANLGATDLNIGHHLELPKKNLRYAFHAMALDEKRPSFLPTQIPGAYRVWFRGAHSDIGGGNQNPKRNDIALKWMMSKAKAAGLPIADADVAALHPDASVGIHPSSELPLDIRVVSATDRVHYSVSPLAGCRDTPATCVVETPDDEQHAMEVGPAGIATLPVEVRRRILAMGQVAENTAVTLDFPLDGVRDALGTFIQGRVPLVTDDVKLQAACDSTARLVAEMVRVAKKHQFMALNEFFLTEALFNLRPIFPFTDD